LIASFSLGAIDNPGIECFARLPPEDFPDMDGPRIR
jgi:hypothetical protein